MKDIKLTIIKEEKRPKEKIQPYYLFKLEFMQGDADADHTDEVKFPLDYDQELLNRFIRFLDNCVNEYKDSGMGGCDDYKHIEDYDYFVEDYDYFDDYFDEDYDQSILDSLDQDFLELCEDIRFDWTYSEYLGGYSELQEYKLFYVDEDGYEHKVEISK